MWIMNKVSIYGNFEEILDHPVFAPVDCDLVIDYEIPAWLHKHPVKPNRLVIFATIQPEGQFNDLIIAHQDKYDHLLTFIPQLLSLPKARFCIALTPFCTPDINIPKVFGVSAVFSGRNACPGHSLRHELYRRRDEIKIPKWFYTGLRSGLRSALELPAEKSAKQRVMNTMFHIAIDSYDYENSFSEKLIDPLITNCYVIYWGCSNLYRYFNPDSIIRINTVSEIIDVCNSVTEETFRRCQSGRLDNFLKAQEYIPYHVVIQKEIDKICAL